MFEILKNFHIQEFSSVNKIFNMFHRAVSHNVPQDRGTLKIKSKAYFSKSNNIG